MGSRHFEVVAYGQPRVPDALLVGLVECQIFVSVSVHDTADDVHVILAQVLHVRVGWVYVIRVSSGLLNITISTTKNYMWLSHDQMTCG